MKILDFLSCGFWSVLGGLLTSLAITGGILAFTYQNSKRGSIELIQLILCGVLFSLLFFQTTLMYGALESKGFVMDLISACHLQFGNEIDGQELKQEMVKQIRENPLVSFFIDYADLEDFDWTQPIKSLRKVVGREYNWYIFRRIIWSVVFSGIAFVGIMLTTGGSHRSRKRRRRSYVFDDDLNFD